MTQVGSRLTAIDRVHEANSTFAQHFELSDLSAPPVRRLAVLTCMDARLHPGQFLGLQAGDAHVITNAGGRASDDAIRSLLVSSRVLGAREVMVIHHTDCGMNKYTDDGLREKFRDEHGVDTSSIGDFLCFSDLYDSVRDDVRRLRESALLEDSLNVRGFVYDVRSGWLEPVEV